MASELLQTISKDEIERAHFLSRRMFQMDMEHNRIAARDEGLDEGRAEGRNEGILHVAMQMLSMGISLDVIMKVTGLTGEQINRLQTPTHGQ